MSIPPSIPDLTALSGRSGFRADGCKVFAGIAQARPANLESLGEEISQWLRDNPDVRIVHIETKITAADVFVWLAVLVFYVGEATSISPRTYPTPTARPDASGSDEALEFPGDSSATAPEESADSDSDEWRLDAGGGAGGE